MAAMLAPFAIPVAVTDTVEAMATQDDVRRIALALPEVAERQATR
jgi:hypothetical protein